MTLISDSSPIYFLSYKLIILHVHTCTDKVKTPKNSKNVI